MGEGKKVNWAYLVTVRDDHEMNVVQSLLEAHEIMVMIKHRSVGEYMSIVMGTSIMGIDIYVPSDQMARGREVLEAFQGEYEED